MDQIMRWLAPVSTMFLLSAPGWAQEDAPVLRAVSAVVDAERYEACLSTIDQDPEAAMESGLAWRAQGGGWSADHCIALSVIANGQFGEGAMRLERTAEGATGAGDQVRAVMFGQAGDAWLVARDSDKAMTAFTRGRYFAPSDAGLALGQAEAALELEDWAMVEAAAGEAISLDETLADVLSFVHQQPTPADAWHLRGRAKLEQGDLDGAREDMEQARQLDPENIEALILRGDILIAENQQAG